MNTPSPEKKSPPIRRLSSSHVNNALEHTPANEIPVLQTIDFASLVPLPDDFDVSLVPLASDFAASSFEQSHNLGPALFNEFATSPAEQPQSLELSLLAQTNDFTASPVARANNSPASPLTQAHNLISTPTPHRRAASFPQPHFSASSASSPFPPSPQSQYASSPYGGTTSPRSMLQCPHCPQQFRYQGRFNTHLAAHAAPLVCPHCGRTFLRPSALTHHVRIHTRPWKCTVTTCRFHVRGFASRRECERHVEERHGGEGTRRWMCPHEGCQYLGSPRASNMRRHALAMHGIEVNMEVEGQGT